MIPQWIEINGDDTTDAINWCRINIGSMIEAGALKWEFREYLHQARFIIYDDQYEILFRLKFQSEKSR